MERVKRNTTPRSMPMPSCVSPARLALLPAFDRVTLMSGGSPLGAIVSASGARWDVRGGVTDDTPARGRKVLSGSIY